jgi:hypothetical protein
LNFFLLFYDVAHHNTPLLEGVVTAPSSTVGRVTVGFELRDEDASACLLRAQTFMSQIINSLQANETLVRAPVWLQQAQEEAHLDLES